MGRGLYRARVFPIEPEGDVEISFSFQQVLPETDGMREFRYPLATHRLHAAPVGETVVVVEVREEEGVKGIWSPSHALAVTRATDQEATASYPDLFTN